VDKLLRECKDIDKIVYIMSLWDLVVSNSHNAITINLPFWVIRKIEAYQDWAYRSGEDYKITDFLNQFDTLTSSEKEEILLKRM
jgi:hypothetical protein